MRVLQAPEKNAELERRLSCTLYGGAEKKGAWELYKSGGGRMILSARGL